MYAVLDSLAQLPEASVGVLPHKTQSHVNCMSSKLKFVRQNFDTGMMKSEDSIVARSTPVDRCLQRGQRAFRVCIPVNQYLEYKVQVLEYQGICSEQYMQFALLQHCTRFLQHEGFGVRSWKCGVCMKRYVHCRVARSHVAYYIPDRRIHQVKYYSTRRKPRQSLRLEERLCNCS